MRNYILLNKEWWNQGAHNGESYGAHGLDRSNLRNFLVSYIFFLFMLHIFVWLQIGVYHSKVKLCIFIVSYESYYCTCYAIFMVSVTSYNYVY